MSRTAGAGLIALAMIACAADPGAGSGPDLDPAARRFDPAHVVEVDIALAPADWDTVREQTRSWLAVYGACLAAPFPSPFTGVPAIVTIDGVRVAGAGVRKKGFLGSLSTTKPSLKIALDVDGRRQLGIDGLTLNNAEQDRSYVRQCLSYQTFAAAGVPAPRCNFAHVRVNGDDLGLYVHVEAIDRDFVARHFDDDRGNLYEGTFSDFRAGWTATFEAETNRTVDDRRDLDAAVAALEQPDPALLAAVDTVIALDPLLTFWAVEVLVTHRDGYAGNANNFFAYHDPARDRFQLLPWGTDRTFLPGPDPFGTGLVSIHAGSLAPWRLARLPAARDRYLATLRRVLDQAWDEDALGRELARMEALIAPIADPAGDRGLAASIDEVRGFVRDRRAAILAELDAGPPEWSAPPREAPCLDRIGTLDGRLHTRWGTAIADAFAAGSGVLVATLDDVPLVVGAVGAAAGSIPATPTRARILLTAALADGTVAVIDLQTDVARLRPGVRLPVDGVVVEGRVHRYQPADGTYTLIGLVTDGSLELAAITLVGGGEVSASFHGTVVSSPF